MRNSTALALAVIVCVLFAANVVTQQKTSNAAVDERIASQSDDLRNQSLEESLAMLDRMEPYNSSEASIGAGTPLFPNNEGRYTENLIRQKIILSSRVFQKCLQEIERLPKKEAARLLDNHLDKALSAYIDAYKSGADFGFASDVDGKPVLRGLQYKVFALLLIAGMCESTENHAMVKKVAEFAMQQKEQTRKRIAEENPTILIVEGAQFLERAQFSALMSTLWNTHILSAGLYGTHPRKNSPEFNEIAKRFAGYHFESATDNDVLTLLGVSESGL